MLKPPRAYINLRWDPVGRDSESGCLGVSIYLTKDTLLPIQSRVDVDLNVSGGRDDRLRLSIAA
jgi:hypothetical protein